MVKMKPGKTVKITSLLLVSLIVTIFLLAFPSRQSFSQSENQVVYDYIILIDTSESMLEGSPTLFSQVQQISQNFVRVIQDGSNLVLYSFDSTFTKLGTWQGITASDKDQIIGTIDNLEATGQYTALWDTVCEGLTTMEEMGKTGGQHIQLLISYTDGKNNIGTKSPQECLGKYEELQKDGYAYWIYNAIGGIGVPDEVNTLKDIIGIVDTDSPVPIRIVHLQPLTLNLGNLYPTGITTPQSSCLLFWSSDPSIAGDEITFNEPPMLDRALPVGVAVQVCAEGDTCERKFLITNEKSCLNVELVNIRPENIAADNLGSYQITLPLQIPYTDPQDRVFLVPNTLGLNFSLDLPPTATNTPLPTSTPQPTQTATPLPNNTVITCGGNEK